LRLQAGESEADRTASSTFTREPCNESAGYEVCHRGGLRALLDLRGGLMDNEIACYNGTGTTGIIIAHASDVTIANNAFKNFKNTGSYDQTAIDHEVLNDNIKVRNNAFLDIPGGAIEYLQLWGRTGDYQLNHEASGNLFVNSG
jgi:hypothetical protein